MKIKFDLKPGINHVFIPVYVNGKGPYNFTLDIGARVTTISSALVDELGLETQEVIGEKYEHLKEKRNLKQVEASLSVDSEELISDEIWAMDLVFSIEVKRKKIIQSSENNGKKIKIVTQPAIRRIIKTTKSGERVIEPSKGVIGYSTLKNYFLSVNYRTRILQLEKNSTGFTHNIRDQLQKFEYIGNTHLVGVPVTINGDGPFPFVLDTGAGGTVISKKLHEKMRDLRNKLYAHSDPVINELKISIKDLSGVPTAFPKKSHSYASLARNDLTILLRNIEKIQNTICDLQASIQGHFQPGDKF